MNIFLFILAIYLILINLIAVIVTIYDKLCAVKRRWRVKESTLLLLSALGGSICMYITMLLIRHKTRHIKFMLGIPLILIVQLIIAFLIWRYFYV
ncbi:MAG: DUF1294 domain-containing protein [Ruminococcus sp.]|nr:DUF1294 domain-containing protein [Ruminococcus sp.]